jgi:hypothetical protein
MKIAIRKTLGLPAALLLLSLLLVAVLAGPASAQSPDPRLRDGFDVHRPVATSSTSTVAHDPRLRDGFDAQQAITGIQPTVVTREAQPAASSGTSTTSWIVAGSIAAALIIVLATWMLLRRRRQTGERAPATFCAHHPEDAVCSA